MTDHIQGSSFLWPRLTFPVFCADGTAHDAFLFPDRIYQNRRAGSSRGPPSRLAIRAVRSCPEQAFKSSLRGPQSRSPPGPTPPQSSPIPAQQLWWMEAARLHENPRPRIQTSPQVVVGIILPEIRRALDCPSMTESSSATATSRPSAWFSSCAGSARHPAATASWATVAQPDMQPDVGTPVDGSISRTCLSPRLRQRPEAECFRRSLERQQETKGQRQIWRHFGEFRDHVSNQPCTKAASFVPSVAFLLSAGAVGRDPLLPGFDPLVGPNCGLMGVRAPKPPCPWRMALQEPSSVDRIGKRDLLMGLPSSAPPSGGLPRSSTTHSP